MFGKIQNFYQKDNKVLIKYDKATATIEIINDYIVNFFVPTFRKEKNSKAIENLKVEKCKFYVKKVNESLVITTSELIIKIYDEFKIDIYDKFGNAICEDYRGKREPFLRRGNDYALKEAEGHKTMTKAEEKIVILKKMEKDMFFYGLGEKTGPLNKRGYHYKMWNTDDPSPHAECFETLYKSIPFFIAVKDKKAFGIFFDNTFETHFDMGKENSNYYYFSSIGGNIDYYFIYGPSIKKVIKGYTKLTGTTPLPQLWTLGYQQSRWSYSSQERVMEIADNYRKRNIPCDVIYLDIDYMDGYRVFTWDKKRFPNPEKMLKDLKKKGFKVVTIVDPGVKKEKGYNIYDEGLKNQYYLTDKDGITYVNKVWPGDAVYPDFSNSQVRDWWANNQKILLNSGVSGIWNDMNEPASFDGDIPDDVKFNNDGIVCDHLEMHNVYGHYMAKAAYEGIKKETNKRPFVITRACYAGTQKYSTVWTGDNQSSWEHLRMAIPMLMNLGLSGISFCGTDVGGFSFDCTSELLNRWVQLGAFTPLFRNHSAVSTRDQEPWAYDKFTEENNKKYIELRYKLLPYLYDLMWNCEKTGLPVFRPLVLNYQNDLNTYEINDEFMCGDNILVAPVVEQGKDHRMVYLPKGDNWIDYWTKKRIQGGSYIIKEAPLNVCPIYIKEGSIIPNYKVQNYIGENENGQLILDVYPNLNDEEITYIHYQDDGESFKYREGIYNLYEFTVKNNIKTNEGIDIKVNILKHDYEKKYNSLKINMNGIDAKEVLVNNDAIDFIKEENCIVFKIAIDNKINIKIK